MSSEAIGAVVAEAADAAVVAMDVDPRPDVDANTNKSETTTTTTTTKPLGLHSPPESSNATNPEASDSELSDIEDMVADQLRAEVPDGQNAPQGPDAPDAAQKEDIGEVLPDHFSGTVPVFKPPMHQFKDFKLFMEKIDEYGMQSGIVKIIPPQEWKDSMPSPEDLVKHIRVREPIKQDIMGTNGTYRQVNILHQRSYNLPQWRQLCDQSEHQPPARRGERRANAERTKPATRPRAATAATAAASTKSRRGQRGGRKSAVASDAAKVADPENRPMTPVSPAAEEAEGDREKPLASVEEEAAGSVKDEDSDAGRTPSGRKGKGFSRQATAAATQSTSARRKYSKREGSAKIDEAAFRGFDYRMDVSDYTPERCEELERIYWKTLTYAPPLYGADLMGTLFDDSTESWNLNKLPNLLDVLGTKVPGVNTAYLYLGMWKATFAWHLEDVDLYSINYLHFGAPKQWYSISQRDARRFEAAMKNIWPADAKACDQFLRHKAFLISPNHLKQHYNITVNRCVSYPGEFVVTYPYGYHSGYNLGYNCAEAVNFALDSWLPMGKSAKRCECAQAQDSVWVDVYEIERRMRGEETDYEETEVEEEEDETDDDDESGLLSPPSSRTARVKIAGKKRKRATRDKDGTTKPKVKKIRLRVGKATAAEPVCCLCPNDVAGLEVLPTDDGRKAHRVCALYLPETYIESAEDGNGEVVANAGGVDKARLDLKCLYCRSKKGACFQCSQKKCARAYHATCAAAAGVFIEEAEVPVFGEDGTEYKEQAFEFGCRFHRTKRDRKLDGDALDGDARVREAAKALRKGEICQLQYYRSDIFAGVVVENRPDEETLLVDLIPNGGRIEVEWKWLLVPNPADFRLPKASARAIPMPASSKAKKEINATKRPANELPRKDEAFADGYTWAEFHTRDEFRDITAPPKVDVFGENAMWHYLARTSTETKAQYTGDVARPVHDPKSNFLSSVPKPAPKPKQSKPKPYAAPYLTATTPYSAQSTTMPPPPTVPARAEKPYVYKPKTPIEPLQRAQQHQQFTAQRPAPQIPAPSFGAAQHQQYRHVQPQFSRATADPRLAKGTTSGPASSAPALAPASAPAAAASYSSTRFAPYGGSNGFPQLPGLTRPPAHMKPGRYPQPPPRSGWSPPQQQQQQHQLQHSAPTTPSRPLQSSSTLQRYSFFQVHHNRDSSRYHTPYAPWGGFTNGYEGNLRAFLLKAQKALSGDKSSGLIQGIPSYLINSPYRPGSGSPPSASSHHQSPPQQRPLQPSAASAASWSPPSSSNPYSQFSTTASPTPTNVPLHPAMRPQYGTPPQQQQQQNSQPPPTHYPQGTSSHAAQQAAPAAAAPPRTPAFNKQSHSPIPLPPYVRRASQASSVAKPSPSHAARQQHLSASPASTSPVSASLASASPVSAQPPPLAADSRGEVQAAPLPTSQANLPPIQPTHQPPESSAHLPRAQAASQDHPFGTYPRSGHAGSSEYEQATDTAVPGASSSESFPHLPATPGDDGASVPPPPPAAKHTSPDEHGHAVAASAQEPETPPGTVRFAEVPTDSTALIERMMRNLRRASGVDGLEG